MAPKYKKLNILVKQSFNVIFILFEIISDLEKINEEMGDDLEDLEESREGKLNPTKSLDIWSHG